MIKTVSKFLAVAALVSVAAVAPALADLAKPEFLAGAKPGGGFDLTCWLAANALLESKQIAAPMTVTYIEGGGGAVAYTTTLWVTAPTPEAPFFDGRAPSSNENCTGLRT